MGNYINTVTGEYPVSFSRVKKVMHGTSFSIEPAAVGDFKRVNDGPIPSFNRDTQFVTEGKPLLVDGSYIRNWVVEDYTTAQIEQRQANAYSSAAKAVRKDRDSKLAETDWRFRSDLVASQAWIDYCQALRDITSQEGFPYAVEWPVEPVE